VALDLETIAEGLEHPLFLTASPGLSGDLYIVQQNGTIRLYSGGTLQPEPFLDLAGTIGSADGERGLLGMAIHPDYLLNGFFYVNYTNVDGNSVIARYRRSLLDPSQADPNTATILLTVEQPFANHNGGMLAFGPDRYLYIALGDGGSANDPNNNAQSLDSLLGKILRIDVDGDAPYGIPADNPFVDTEGARPEIWAYGLRNPWRFSFDRQSGDLWIGDVGQNTFEEINFQDSNSGGGINYGWRNREGNLCRNGEEDCEVPGATDPLLAYFRVGNQAVTGGYVYRGEAIPSLNGTYLFADFVDQSVFSLTQPGGEVALLNETDNLQGATTDFGGIASFGEDSAGELYVLDYEKGDVYKIVAAE
jgi:glucose/arabinose dehydrogenase